MKPERVVIISLLCFCSYAGWSQNGWTHQTPSSEYPGLLGVCAIDSLHVWAVGQEGTILHSTDGGTSWNALQADYEDSFTTVMFLNRDTGFISGNPALGDAFVIRTTDGGTNWERIGLSTAAPTTVNDMAYYHSEEDDTITIYAAGGLGHVWKSTDCGDSWIGLGGGCGNGNYNSCCIINENTGWFVGTPDASNDHSIMYTADGGILFTEQINPEERKLNGVSFCDENHGIAVGLAYTILSTDNGGETWIKRESEGYRWWSVVLNKSGNGWAVGNDGQIIHSADFGNTWELQETGVSCELWDVAFINDHEGWAVGGGIGDPGTVLHFSAEGTEPSGINRDNGDTHPFLGQNFPNPFKQTTQIRYQIPFPGMITIILYDVLGNQLEVLIDVYQPKGSYSFDFVNDHYPDGIYFYDLNINAQRIQTRRMVMME